MAVTGGLFARGIGMPSGVQSGLAMGRTPSSSSSRSTTGGSNVISTDGGEPRIPEVKVPGQKAYSSMLEKIIKKYQPGGPFQKAGLKEYQRKKTRETSKLRQGIISRGLTGTTQAGLVGAKYEQAVGTPYKMGLEEQRTAGLTQALQAKARMSEQLASLRQQRDIAEANLRSAEEQAAMTLHGSIVESKEKSMSGSSSGGLGGFGTDEKSGGTDEKSGGTDEKSGGTDEKSGGGGTGPSDYGGAMGWRDDGTWGPIEPGSQPAVPPKESRPPGWWYDGSV